MPQEYLTVREYANVNNIPEQHVIAAIKAGRVDHCTMLMRRYERVYLIPSRAQIPIEFVPNVDRFREEDTPPWQSPQT